VVRNKLLSAVINPRYGVYAAAKKFVRHYENFSFDFDRNGERLLLERLGAFPFRTILDVGANVGDWTKIARSYFPKATIHCFELSAATYSNLQHNLAGAANVQLNQFGLSDAEGEITYKDYGQDSGFNTILQNGQFHDNWLPFAEKKGKLLTGDQYCAARSISEIDLLKIDVEGAESLVLSGFADLLANHCIKVIQFEYGYANADAHFLMKDFYGLFREHGYEVGPLKARGVLFQEFNYRLNDFQSGPNFVAVAKDRPELIRALRGPDLLGYS
jgi:FkbM family methyltransferase